MDTSELDRSDCQFSKIGYFTSIGFLRKLEVGGIGVANPLLTGSLPPSSICRGNEALLTLSVSSRHIPSSRIAAPRYFLAGTPKVVRSALNKGVGVEESGPPPEAR